MATTPSEPDALNLAGIRTLVNLIENAAISMYITNRDNMSDIVTLMEGLVNELEALPLPAAGPKNGNGCDPPFTPCHGRCQMMCANYSYVPESAGAKKAKGKAGAKHKGK